MALSKLHLYEGPSGPRLVGQAGDVLTWSATEGAWVAAPAAGGSGSPLPDAVYVSHLAAPGGNGSQGAPFATLADGLLAAANTAADPAIVCIGPGDYSAEGVLAWNSPGRLMLVGYGSEVALPYAGADGALPILPSITAAFGLPDLFLDSIELGATQQFNNFTNISGVGSKLTATMLASGDVRLARCTMTGSFQVNGNLYLRDCTTSGDSSWTIGGDTVELVDTTILAFGAASIVFQAAPGTVKVDDFSNFRFVALNIPIANGVKQVISVAADPPGDVILTAVPAMPANTYADVTVASAIGTGPNFVGVAGIIDAAPPFPRQANLSVPMVFSPAVGQLTFRFFGTVAAPVTQSIFVVRVYPSG